MYKFIYFSKKKSQIVSVYFTNHDDLLDFMANEYDDFDLVDHFVKVVKE